MRRRVPALLMLVVLLAGCGGDPAGSPAAKKQTPAEVVRAAAATPAQTSSRIEMTSTTDAGGQDVVVTMTGLFGASSGSPVGEMTMKIGPTEIKQIMIGGDLFMQLPGESGYYRLPLKELGSTSLGDSANPGSSADLLRGLGDDVTEVGKETIRGASTTHYKGTISVAKAEQLAKDDLSRKSVERLGTLGVTSIPVDVYLDGEGRLRRLIQHLKLTVKGVKATSTNRLDFFDFGVKVDVKRPPASDIKDGTELLKTIKSQLG